MNKVIVVAGPTATGKSELGISLALRYNGEIINADSTQVYKKMDIATAKVPPQKRKNVKHHLLDIKEIEENYTVFDFQRDCREKISEIQKRGKIPILVGGTGLYIKAALYDYTFEKESVCFSYDDFSNQELYEKLKKIDSSTSIHPNNRKRIERALSYYQAHHKPFGEKEKSHCLLYDTICIGLTAERSILYEKINHRVENMVTDGLLQEALSIYHSDIRSKAVLTPIGYKELFPFFDGVASLDFCLDKIRQNSRRYAKRQWTWFRHQMDFAWFETNYDCFDKTIQEVCDFIDKELSST